MQDNKPNESLLENISIENTYHKIEVIDKINTNTSISNERKRVFLKLANHPRFTVAKLTPGASESNLSEHPLMDTLFKQRTPEEVKKFAQM